MGLTTTNTVDIRGKAFEEVFMEVIFQNNTLGKRYVNFASGIKGDEIFSDISSSLTLQAYTANPSASGSLTLTERLLRPKKVELHDVFDPEQLRFTRFQSDMSAGAFENVSGEFQKQMLNHLSPKISQLFEQKFWTGVKATTQAAVAGLAPGVLNTEVSAAEQAAIAALTVSVATAANQHDGILAKMIYDTQTAAVGTRIKVAGTTITSATLVAEYAKLYAAVPSENLQNEEMIKIYAPHSHRKLFNIVNTAATYRDVIMKEGTGSTARYFYNSLEVYFVPLPENVMICANPNNLVWLCDLESDYEQIVVDDMPKPRKDKYYDVVATIETHVANQAQNVLYVG